MTQFYSAAMQLIYVKTDACWEIWITTIILLLKSVKLIKYCNGNKETFTGLVINFHKTKQMIISNFNYVILGHRNYLFL